MAAQNAQSLDAVVEETIALAHQAIEQRAGSGNLNRGISGVSA
jgi:hypothetical protein